MAGGYLPDIVVEVIADTAEAMAKLQEVKGELEDWPLRAATELVLITEQFDRDFAREKAKMEAWVGRTWFTNLGVQEDATFEPNLRSAKTFLDENWQQQVFVTNLGADKKSLSVDLERAEREVTEKWESKTFEATLGLQMEQLEDAIQEASDFVKKQWSNKEFLASLSLLTNKVAEAIEGAKGVVAEDWESQTFRANLGLLAEGLPAAMKEAAAVVDKGWSNKQFAAQLTATYEALPGVIAEATALVKQFDKVKGTAKLTADFSGLADIIEQATAKIMEFSNVVGTATLDLKAAVEVADIVNGTKDAVTLAQGVADADPVDLPIHIDSKFAEDFVQLWDSVLASLHGNVSITGFTAIADDLAGLQADAERTAAEFLALRDVADGVFTQNTIDRARQLWEDLQFLTVAIGDAAAAAKGEPIEVAVHIDRTPFYAMREDLAGLAIDAAKTATEFDALSGAGGMFTPDTIDRARELMDDFRFIEESIANIPGGLELLGSIFDELAQKDPFLSVRTLRQTLADIMPMVQEFKDQWTGDPWSKDLLINNDEAVGKLVSTTELLQAWASHDYKVAIGVEDAGFIDTIAGLDTLMAAAGRVRQDIPQFGPGDIAATLDGVKQQVTLLTNQADTLFDDMVGAINPLTLAAERTRQTFSDLGESFRRAMSDADPLGGSLSDLADTLRLANLQADGSLGAFDDLTTLFDDMIPAITKADLAQRDAAKSMRDLGAAYGRVDLAKRMLDYSDAMEKAKNDAAAVDSSINQMVNDLQKLDKAKISVDTTEAWNKVQELHHYVTQPEQMPVGVSLTDYATETEKAIAVMKAELAAANLTATIRANTTGVAGAAGLAALAGSSWKGGGGGGGWGGWGALAADTGFGQGANIPFTNLPALSSMGSLAAMGGFGMEHLLMTGAGVVGSGVQGALGGGLLAGASAATSAVGMGTDLAGIGQAMGDIKAVTTAQNNYNTAVAQYGPASQQAAQAQNLVNNTLAGFSPVAQQSVLAAVTAKDNFKKMFDAVTGGAENTGAQIITQFIGLGQKFLPVIGKYATENTKIIQTGLQPLIAWIGGPGLAIFTQLEQKFQQGLPRSLDTLTKAFEFLVRTIGYISPQTGGLMKSLDRIFTKVNSPTGWAKWTKEVDHLIGQFHVWEAFLKVLIEDVAKLFGDTSKVGTAVVQQLTGYLQHLHQALSTTGKNSSLATMFSEHRTQVLQLLDLVVKVGTAWGKGYIQMAPVVLGIVNGILRIMLMISNMKPLGINVGGFITAGIGLGILLNQMKILGPLLGGAAKDAGLMSKMIGAVGFKGLSGASKDGTGMMASLLGATPSGQDDKRIVGWVKGQLDMAKTAVGVFALEAKDKIAGAFTKRAASGAGFIDFSGLDGKLSGLKGKIASFASDAKSKLASFASSIGPALSAVGGHLADWASKGKAAFSQFASSAATFAADFGKQMVAGVKSIAVFIAEHAAAAAAFVAENLVMIASATAAFIAENAATLGIVAGITLLVGGIIYLATHWHQVWTDIKNWVMDAWHFIHHIFNDGIIGDLLSIAFPLIGLLTHWQEVWGIVKTVIRDAWGVIDGVFHLIVDGVQLLWQGVQDYIQLVIDIFIKFPETILGYVADAGSWLLQTGEHIVEGLINGIGNMAGKLMDKIKGLAGDIIHGIGSFLGIASPSTITTQMGVDFSQGLANGIANNKGAVTDAAKNVANGASTAMTVDTSGASSAGKGFTQALANGLTSQGQVLADAARTVNSQLVAAFAAGGSAGTAGTAIKLAATNMSQVGQIFSNLKGVFADLESAAASSASVAPNVRTVTTAVGLLADTIKSDDLTGKLKDLEGSFKSIGGGDAIKKMGDAIGATGHLFDTLNSTAASAAKLNWINMGQLNAGFKLVEQEAPALASGISSIINSFASLSGATIGKNGSITPFSMEGSDKQINSIQKMLGDVGHLFDTFGRTAQSAGKVTQQGMSDMWYGMGHVLGAIQPLLAGVTAIATQIKALGNEGKGKPVIDVKTIFGDLNNLMTSFQKVSDLFGKVKEAMNSASGITPASVKPITDAIAAIQGALASLPQTVTTASKSLGDISTMVTTMASDLTSGSALALFKNSGTNLIQQFQNGMHDQLIVAGQREATNFGFVLGALAGDTRRAYGDFRNAGINLVQQVQDGFHDQLFNAFVPRENSNISTALSQVTTSFAGDQLTKFHDAGKGLVDALARGVDDGNARNAVTQGLASLINGLGGILNSGFAYNQFYSAGVSMVQGMSAGINAAAGSAAVAAANAAQSAVAAAKAATKTNSPSLVFDQMGRDWMAGLTQGIVAQTHTVRAAVLSAVPSVTAPSSISPATGGGTSLTVNANFTINAPGGNPQAIKQALGHDAAQQFAQATITSLRAGAGRVYG